MCQNHAHEIDTDETRFTVEILKDWKERHESQIRGQADGKWLLPKIELKKFNSSHDRFLIIDEKEVYHIGASLKDFGKKWFAFSKIELDPLAMLDRLK